MKRQIIALGGGGFSMEPDNPLLDDYILQQCNKATPKICFVGTASGDAEAYIANFYMAFKDKDCIPSHLSLFNGHTDQIQAFVMEQDIIYVGGGNTRNMLVLWKEWGVDVMLQKAYHNGTILCGISAGSICWFEEGLTDSIPNQLNVIQCLGILKGSNCPHFDGEPERRPAYINKIKSGAMKPGIACDDSVALHFVNETLEKIIASKEGVFAYEFKRKDGEIIEEKRRPLWLG